MTWFILRRMVSALVVIVGVVTVIFILSRLVGDPVALMIQPGMTDADVAQLRAVWHLDDPIIAQYWRFLVSALEGDFGLSIWQSQPALGLVLEALPATLLLTASALGFALVLGGILGALSAIYKGSVLDRGIMGLTLFGQSMPNFWLALMLILVVSTQWKLLPPAGFGEPRYLVLPMIALGLFPLARLTRLIRSELLDVLGQDYIRTARSKGVPTGQILLRHCLGNIAISLITVLAVDFALLMGGAVVTETIFAWPGMGRLMIQAIERRDFPVMQAGAFVVAMVVVLTSLAADLAYSAVNPKVRYA
ncbi:Peptide/nickel transport system permease protein [Hyphomicrobiales bacterium]|nr:Peptide/nickel transport system permease protein [Hyphomicrobiales bacterium]CAH1689090.1 Peptide/nickel transport system permease protein [Hyphomicrobiales bacterium]